MCRDSVLFYLCEFELREYCQRMNIHVQCYSPTFWSVQKVLTWRNNSGSEHQVPQRGGGTDMSTPHRNSNIGQSHAGHKHVTPRQGRSRNVSGEIVLRRSGSISDRPTTAGSTKSAFQLSRSSSRPRSFGNVSKVQVKLSVGLGMSFDVAQIQLEKQAKQDDSDSSENLSKLQLQRRSSLKMSYHEKKVSSFHVNCIPDIFNDMAYSHLDHTHKDGGKCCREEDYRMIEIIFYT